jgi:hypothetical protein
MSKFSILSLKKLAYILLLALFPVIMIPATTGAIQSPPTYFAKDVLGTSIDCTDPANKTSAYCTDNTGNNGVYGNGGAFQHITNIVAFAAGAAAILLLIISGIRYVTSGGDTNKTSSAKSTIVGALIGIAVIVLARSLINYVVGKL